MGEESWKQEIPECIASGQTPLGDNRPAYYRPSVSIPFFAGLEKCQQKKGGESNGEITTCNHYTGNVHDLSAV